MPYVEVQALGPSSRFVQAFWQSTGVFPSTATRRVLPDACADFIFDLADAALATRDCAAIVGTMTRAIVVASSGRRHLFGIRFKPGAPSLLWRLPMRPLCDDRATLDEVVPDAASLTERLSETDDFHVRIGAAQTWIESRLARSDIDVAKLRTVAAINDRLEAGESCGALAALTGWNERKLQRFFETTYGTTPATMRCFWRFEKVRRALVQEPTRRLSALALDRGYADQAHMAREFRRFAGLSIGAWRAETTAAL